MTPSEIITTDARNNGQDPDYFLKTVAKILKGKLGILLQKNDTVLLVIRLGHGKAELHIATADSPLRVLSALKYFVKKMDESELHTYYLPSVPVNTLSILKKLDVKLLPSNLKQYKVMLKT